MRDMIQAILAAPMPIVMYVAPSGARAASAGTYLLYASHVAAMAPATNLGAATPVSIGGPTPAAPGAGDHGSSPDEEQDGESPPAAAKPAAPEPGGAMERKAVNDAVAYIRSLAELRGRNADWAEEAVRGAASLSAQQALELGVVDLIAEGVPDLLEQIDGRQVKVASGEITIESGSLVLERVEMDWRTRLLAVITNPTTAYLLMLVGIYGLLLEGYNPGAILPGVVGAISLLLALFAFQVLSVNYAGLALILLGVLLIVAEAFAPSFGALGLGGIIAFVIGSIVLLDTDIPGLAIARPLIAAMGFVGGLATLGIVTFAVRSRDRPIVAGREQLLHETAVALCDFDREGTVRLHGEIWQARSAQSVVAGQRLRIVAVEGLTLTVEPLPDGSP
jgi:membrane-bound serine protease (ClpP class)